MNAKKLIVSAIALSSFVAFAQMPVPLLDEKSSNTPSLQNANSSKLLGDRKQIEALLQCKNGTQFSPAKLQSQLNAIGLFKGGDGIFTSAASGPKVVIFNDEVLAASVDDADGEKKFSVYLKTKTGKQMAENLGVTKRDEGANTDDDSYFKNTSKKTTLLVGSASELFIGNDKIIKYQSTISCRVTK